MLLLGLLPLIQYWPATSGRVLLGPGDGILMFLPLSIAAPLVVCAILFGVYPQAIFNYMTPTIDRTVNDLAAWTKNVKDPRLKHEATAANESETGSVHADGLAVAGEMNERPGS